MQNIQNIGKYSFKGPLWRHEQVQDLVSIFLMKDPGHATLVTAVSLIDQSQDTIANDRFIKIFWNKSFPYDIKIFNIKKKISDKVQLLFPLEGSRGLRVTR